MSNNVSTDVMLIMQAQQISKHRDNDVPGEKTRGTAVAGS